MLLKHGAIYLIARGAPGLIGFVTIMVYTRLLSPESYGQYSLVLTGAIVVNAVLYQWLSASLLRFLPQYQEDDRVLLKAILFGFLAVSILAGAAGVLLTRIGYGREWDYLILIGVLLVWAQAWFTINLEMMRSQLFPIRYGLASLLKATVALGLGVALILVGLDTSGALLGLLVALVIGGTWSCWGRWRGLRQAAFDRKLAHKVLNYGLPLTASFTLAVLISSMDRFMLAGMIGESATGLYAAGQGVAQQAVGVSMMMVNLAAYPLIIRTLENVGPDATREQLRRTAILLLIVGLPLATVFIVLSSEIATLFLGAEFRAAGTDLMPWFAISTLLTSMRAYYFDLAFYLGKRTRIQMAVMGSALILNLVLNIWLIPRYGLFGAAIASVCAHGLAITMSAIVGRRAFRLPTIIREVAGLAVATLAMAFVLLVSPFGGGVFGLVLSVALGGIVYSSFIVAFNIGDANEVATHLLGQMARIFHRD